MHIAMTDAHESASRLLDTIPLIMGALRHQMRDRRPGKMSVPQFRVMVYLGLHGGAMLSDVSNHIGLSRPTMSKMVDALVRKRWVSRRIPPDNRRSVRLGLTDAGQKVMSDAREEARRKLAESLGRLSPGEQKTVIAAMALLGKVFAPDSQNRNGRNPGDLR